MDILLKQVRRPRTWQLDDRPRSSENRNSAFSVIDDDEVASAMVQGALAASEIQARNQAKVKRAYDYIVIGSGASGAIIAGELSKTGAEVLVVEAGGEDVGATITDPSIWFYNVGGPFDWALPIVPVPQLNNRRFNMALGRVLGGGSSVSVPKTLSALFS